jgi:hypothetical protein
MKAFHRFYNVHFSSRIKKFGVSHTLDARLRIRSYSTLRNTTGAYTTHSRIKTMEYVIYGCSDANK